MQFFRLFINKVRIFILVILIIGVFMPLFFVFPQMVYAEVKYPEYNGFVNDFAGILDSSTIDKISGVVNEVNSKTTAEIAVVTVKNLQGITVEEYAVELFQKWGIGKKDKDNGILLLISEEDRKLRIEVGYGLEGVVTDLEAGRIIDNIIVPQFKAGDYNTGTYNGVIAIANEIYTDAGLPVAGEVASVEYSSPKDPPYFWICCAPFFGIIFIIVTLVNIFSRKCPKCKKFKLKTTVKVITPATYTESGSEIVIRDCSNCGFHDEKTRKISRKTRSSGVGFFSGGGGSSGGW